MWMAMAMKRALHLVVEDVDYSEIVCVLETSGSATAI